MKPAQMSIIMDALRGAINKALGRDDFDVAVMICSDREDDMELLANGIPRAKLLAMLTHAAANLPAAPQHSVDDG